MLLIRPFFLGTKNRIFGRKHVSQDYIRAALLLGFAFLIQILFFEGTVRALYKANENPNLAVLPPALLLGLALSFLLIMLVIPAIFVSLGSFFLAEDLDLILASPLSPWRFYAARLMAVIVTAGWMPFLFILPIVAAFGYYYHVTSALLLHAMLLLPAYFFIPSGLALIVSIVVASAIPLHRAKFFGYLLGVASLAGLYLLFQSVRADWSSANSSAQVLRLLRVMKLSSIDWLPSTWVSHALEEHVMGRTTSWIERDFVLLYSAAAGILALGYIMFRLFHVRAYSNSRSRSRRTVGLHSFVERGFSIALSKFPPPARALMMKDTKVLLRDLGQVIQLAVLMILALLYLQNVKLLAVLNTVPKPGANWWRDFLFISNICMGAFLSTSMCTRLVFPSISLEGKAYWILQSAPLGPKELLRTKFYCWLIPLTLVSVLFFTAGALAIGADAPTIVLSAILSLVLCYAVVGLAVGMGALFARFDWEHPSQLAASLGSLLYMMCAIMLVFANMLPAWLLLAGDRLYFSLLGLTLTQTIVVYVLCISVLNFIIVRVLLRAGARALVNNHT